MRPDEVFILRFWLEETDTHELLRWRGQIRNVNTKEREITNDIDTAFGSIASRLRAALAAEKERLK
jgi:hypothetical protein